MLINVVLCLLFSLKITSPLVQPLLTDCVDKPPMREAFLFMVTQEEIWKDVVGYEGFYIVSSRGRVASLNVRVKCKNGTRSSNGKIICQSKSGRGYYNLSLSKNGESKTKLAHRLVAEAFIPNPHNKAYVNHINGNGYDNNVANLEWATPKENYDHAVKYGLLIQLKNNRRDLSKPILQLDMSGSIIKEFPSANEAMRETGLSAKWIGVCANGGSFRKSGGVVKWVSCRSNGGYRWEWKAVKI